VCVRGCAGGAVAERWVVRIPVDAESAGSDPRRIDI
jgi:hypothetical protein